MPLDDMAKFRRHLCDWLQFRLAGNRTPFRRVEETPLVITGSRLATPDLVLWINRDSLLAGAVVLLSHRGEPWSSQEGCVLAASLGLRQYVTWDATAVILWEAGMDAPHPLKSWPLPVTATVSNENFAITFEALLGELTKQAIAAVLPAEQLPPAYFVNLCRQVLRDSEPALLATARVAARSGEAEADTLRQAREQGWLTLWRLLALLCYERMPVGVRPGHLARAIHYALADLPPVLVRLLLPAADDPPLPEDAAIRLHHLSGRLAQLGWYRDAERGRQTLALLLEATACDCQVATDPLKFVPQPGDLLVNHLPPQPLTGTVLLAPRPCLAGLGLTAAVTEVALPEVLVAELADLPVGYQPERVSATLTAVQPASPARRRQRLTALRHSWPYRRFRLGAATPAWLWDALQLGGLIGPDGTLLLTLPAGWSTVPGAELLWRTISERLALAALQLHDDGCQTLTLVGHSLAPAALTFREPAGTCRLLPVLTRDAGVTAVAALANAAALPSKRPQRPARPRPAAATAIAAKVFRDGVPDFPGQYLRRYDLPPLRSYHVSGPLHSASHFFERVSLSGPDGSLLEASSAADAEALLLASHDGRPRRIDLPTDPLLTARLVAAYRHDLKQLWQELVSECRRHHPVQHRALALARRLWQERHLPPLGSD